MDEMAQLKKLLNPSEILFVADAMTGQDAVNSAKAFNDRLTITGVILTKMDGDARGGAALSIRHVTGAAHQVHRHRRKARRLRALPPRPHRRPHLGMGDIATLLERAEENSTAAKPSSSPRRPSPATASRSKTSASSSARSRRWAA
jgi:signal recognition particle subunit SRP54